MSFELLAMVGMKNGRMVPEGIKVISKWLDTEGGRAVWLYEADLAIEKF